MLFAWPLIGRRPRGRDLAGLTLCVAGIAALFGSGGAIGIENLPRRVLRVGRALLFALGTILLKPIALPPFAAVAWQLVIGCTPMIVLGLLFEHPRVDALSPLGVGLMAYMTGRADGRLLPDVVRSAASAARRKKTASVATLLTPIIGVSAAAIALGEPSGVKESFALVLAVGGLALVLRKR